ncbi:MAG: phosphatase [Lachnospiraceae bacterium]
MEVDLHTHTIASGHGSADTIQMMVKTAAARGVRLLGISDHGPRTTGSASESYFRSLRYAPHHRSGVELLYGAEANIISAAGELDLGSTTLAGLDYVIASMHPVLFAPGDIVHNTQALLRTMQNPYVRIIGHPDDTAYPLDYPEIFQEAMKRHILLEINDSSLSPEGYRGDTRHNDLTLLQLCRQYRYPVLLGSDSHGVARLGSFTYAGALLRSVAFPEELLLNRRPEAVKDFLHKK